MASREKDAKRKRNEAYANHIAAKRKTKDTKRSAKASRQSARDQLRNEFARGDT